MNSSEQPLESQNAAPQNREFGQSVDADENRLDKDVWEFKCDGVVIVSGEKMKRLRAEGKVID